MDFGFTEEQRLLRDSVRKLLQKHAPPEYVRQHDRERTYPEELFQACAEAGLLALPFPEEYGGAGVDTTTFAMIFEEISRGWLGLAGYQGLALAAVAGLDIALWDALAQAAGLPLAVLLGGTLAPVPAYNSNGLGLIPPENAATEALELLDEGGFTALKVRVGRARAADDVAAVRHVRAAVGDEVTLVADYNQGLSLGEALQRCRALDAEGLAWIEEPLRYDDLDGHARLAADLATPVMLGENFYGSRAMYEAIRSRACDLVMPDLMRIGGVTGWLQAAAIADVTGLPMSSHLYPEVSGHLLRVTPTGQWLEWQDWAHPVLARPFEVSSGQLYLPDVPGNGLEWDESAVAHYQAGL